MRLVCFVLTVIASLLSAPMHVRAEWRLASLAEPCRGDCAVTIFGGRLAETPMYKIFGKPELPWDWRWGSSQLVSGTLSREVVGYRDWFFIELEAGIGKRFGRLHEGEVWGAAYARWKLFPWNDYVRTTIAVSTGLNYATDVPAYERLRSGSDKSPHLLHYLSPEITFGLPSSPDIDLVLRLHHRSGGKANIFNSASGGAQYGEAGIRMRF